MTEIGVRANADHRLFPDNWLFSLRWSKGKKGKKDITLPDGTTHEITYMTVGGRTSAVVATLQILPEAVEKAINDKLALTARRKAEKGETSSSPSKVKGKGKRKAVDVDSDEGEAQLTASDDAEEEVEENGLDGEDSDEQASDEDEEDNKTIVSRFPDSRRSMLTIGSDIALFQEIEIKKDRFHVGQIHAPRHSRLAQQVRQDVKERYSQGRQSRKEGCQGDDETIEASPQGGGGF